MTGRRIEFPSDDAARFNALRDQWRGAAASLPLSRSAMRIATVLPTYVSREFGYAFPTDDDLRSNLNASRETVKRGLADLEKADLIDRETRSKRGDDGRTPGKERRIFLTIPMGQPKGQKASEPMGQSAASPKGQPMGQAPKGQASPKGQKWPTDGSYGGPNILDSDTPDFQIRSGDRKGSVYAREADPSPRADPSPDPSVAPSPRPAPSLPRNPHWVPDGYGEDAAFLELFDRFVLEVAGPEVEAGALERITAEAFDRATRAGDFMPIFWSDVVAVRKNPFAEWFRFRAGSLIHSEVA